MPKDFYHATHITSQQVHDFFDILWSYSDFVLGASTLEDFMDNCAHVLGPHVEAMCVDDDE